MPASDVAEQAIAAPLIAPALQTSSTAPASCPPFKFHSLAAIILVFAALFAFGQPRFPNKGVGFKLVPDPVEVPEAPVYVSQIVSKGLVSEVHSPTLVPLANGGVYAFWYGGEREGSPDTAIYSAKLDPATSKWSEERPAIDRITTQTHVHRFVKKLGNAVALRDDKGQIWLFYVTSMWGWSGSAINFIRSSDEGATWSPSQRLITSPFLNHSTLVRGQPFQFADGTIGLPVYHEFIGKFCELLRLDENGTIIHKQRISYGRTSLQPAIVPITEQHAFCSMRPAGSSPRKLLVSVTQDGGRTWSATASAGIHSDYSGSAGVGMENNDLLTVTRNEEKLLFFISKDGGGTFTKVHEIDHTLDDGMNKRKNGPSYPCLMQTPDGDYHLIYSLERMEIRHVRFNQAWLNSLRK